MVNLLKEYNRAKAFKKIFLSKDGKLTPEGKIVFLAFREMCNGKGEREVNGSPFFYDTQGRFDKDAAVYYTARRNIFDQLVRYLSIDEMEVFSLMGADEDKQKTLIDDLTRI